MRVSGGGVTVSGGEPLRQVPFARALLAQARGLGLHTALDTSGFGNPFALRGLAHLADLVVVDASAWDLARGEGTRPSTLLPRLLKEGTQSVRLRVAILPGINDGAAGLARLADLAQALPRLERVEVVAWQGLPGLDGIEACPLLSSLAPVGPEALRSARNVFRLRGLRAE
jgi:pyruvate formate lyase activating enzyme